MKIFLNIPHRLNELQLAWDVNVPGLGKRNRLAIVDIPQNLPPTEALIRRSIADECQTMLHPPVSMVGIPAMKKLASEIVHWPEELGEDTADKILRQVREYLNSTPDLEGNHLTAGRDRYIPFLQEAEPMAGLDFSTAIQMLGESMAMIPELADAIRKKDLKKAATGFEQVAEAESAAYLELSQIVGQRIFDPHLPDHQ